MVILLVSKPVFNCSNKIGELQIHYISTQTNPTTFELSENLSRVHALDSVRSRYDEMNNFLSTWLRWILWLLCKVWKTSFRIHSWTPQWIQPDVAGQRFLGDELAVGFGTVGARVIILSTRTHLLPFQMNQRYFFGDKAPAGPLVRQRLGNLMVPNWNSAHTDTLIMYPHLFHSYVAHYDLLYYLIVYYQRRGTIPVRGGSHAALIPSRRPRRPSLFSSTSGTQPRTSFFIYLPKLTLYRILNSYWKKRILLRKYSRTASRKKILQTETTFILSVLYDRRGPHRNPRIAVNSARV